MQVICVANRVICGPVSAGLIPHLLESGTWRRDLIIVLYKGDTHPSWVIRVKQYGDHREDIDGRVGSFPRPGRLIERFPRPCGRRGC